MTRRDPATGRLLTAEECERLECKVALALAALVAAARIALEHGDGDQHSGELTGYPVSQ